MTKPPVEHRLTAVATLKVFFCVQGLFEKSDSIGFDCVYQYNLLREHFGASSDIRLFAERADHSRYPTARVQPISELFDFKHDKDLIIVYHFCDGWPDLERRLPEFAGKIVIRWHNNTPPWFFGEHSPHSVRRTIGGFQAIQHLGPE